MHVQDLNVYDWRNDRAEVTKLWISLQWSLKAIQASAQLTCAVQSDSHSQYILCTYLRRYVHVLWYIWYYVCYWPAAGAFLRIGSDTNPAVKKRTLSGFTTQSGLSEGLKLPKAAFHFSSCSRGWRGCTGKISRQKLTAVLSLDLWDDLNQIADGSSFTSWWVYWRSWHTIAMRKLKR